MIYDPISDCADAKCQQQFQDAFFALGYAALANTAMVAACVVPGVNVLACAIATAHAAWAAAEFLAKNATYGRCMAQAREACRKCFDELEPAPLVYLGFDAGRSRVENAPAVRGLDSFGSRDACVVDWEFEDDGPANGGGVTIGYYETCYWLIAWDQFGTIIFTELLGCEEYEE